MITLLFGAIGKFLKLPAWAHVGLAAFIGLSLMQIAHARVVHRLKQEIAARDTVLQSNAVSIALLRVSETQGRLNAAGLEAMIAAQNAATQQMQAKAQADVASSRLAVNKALQAGRDAAAARLTSTVAPGFESLNAEASRLWSTP